MTTTVNELKRWFETGLRSNCKGMILLKNKATGDEYPVYVRSDQDLREQVKNYVRSYTDDVLTWFDCRSPIEEQLLDEAVFSERGV